MANEDYVVQGSGGFTPMCELQNAVGYLDTRFYITNLNVEDPGTDIYIGMSIMVGEEICRIDFIDELYVDVARGCADTIPWEHSAGALIWFYPDDIGGDDREHGSGETLSIKLLTRTNSDYLPIEKSPPNELTFNWRFQRPYAPGQMMVNTFNWFQDFMLTADIGALVLTWVHRDRVTQADTLVSHVEGGIGPEPGTTYWMSVYKIEEGNPDPVLVRTEVGITGTTFTYTWAQAAADFDHDVDPDGPEEGTPIEGFLMFGSSRDDLESWQAYRINFTHNNAAALMRVAQFAMQSADDSPDLGPTYSGMFVPEAGEQVAQEDGDAYSETPLAGVMTSETAAQSGQEHSVYRPFVRNLFESSYTQNIRREGSMPATARVTTVGARHTDRMTDQQEIWSRRLIQSHELEYRKTGVFTPWATISADMDYMTDWITLDKTSFVDGVPLSSVMPGQLAIVDQELVRVDEIAGMSVKLARGCADTIPWKHFKGARIWFFEAYSIVDETPWPRPSGDQGTINLEYKAAPVVFGPHVDMDEVYGDQLNIKSRQWRPLPVAHLLIAGKRWYLGHRISPNEVVPITWSQRNRITQAATVVSHDEPNYAHEQGTRYNIKVELFKTVEGNQRVLKVRDSWTDGTRFDYTWEMALSDGYKAGIFLGACGNVTLPIRVNAWRDGLSNWQSYTVLLTVPAPPCKPGQTPGGGGPGSSTGGLGGAGTGGDGVGSGGNGSTGGGSQNPGSPGNPGDPLDNSHGPDGSGPLPIDPGTPVVPPMPPNPESEMYWDVNWDEFYAANPYDDSIYDGNDPASDDDIGG